MSLLFYNGLLQYRINQRFLSTSNLIRSHYKVLKLPKNCTHKDIKDSFIKLSKEHHPDLNKHKDAHKKFLEINEAYNVLSKPESRRLYDLGFARTTYNTDRTNIRYRDHYSSDPWKDPSFYQNRDRSQDKYYDSSRGYYGIKGIQKVSNFTVAIVCVSVTLFVLGLQMLAVRYSYTFRRDNMIKRSNEAEESLRQIRQTAEKNGNALQLEILRMRFENHEKNK